MQRFFVFVGMAILMVGLAGQTARADDNNKRSGNGGWVAPGQPAPRPQPVPVAPNPGYGSGNGARWNASKPTPSSDHPSYSGGSGRLVIPGKPRPKPDAATTTSSSSTSSSGVSTIPPPAYKTWPRQPPKGYPYGYGPSSPYDPYYSGYYPYGSSYSPSGYSPYGYSPYGYSPYGYSPYSYSPYGYSPYSSGPYGYWPYRTYWPGMGLIGSPYVFSPWYGMSSPWSRSYSPNEYAYAYPAAMFVPAGQLFGPGVGIGVLPNIPSEAVPPAGAVPVAGNPSGNRDFAPSAEPSQAEPPANSAEQELRHGDGLFASRKHADALDHYIKAVEMSPQMADAWFRQGFAQSAEGEYALAAKSLRKAMELKPDWAGSSFRLATMYGNDTVGKRSRMTALYAAARRDPNDADVQFLIGAHLYFDGRADRAVQYFQHAEKLQEK